LIVKTHGIVLRYWPFSNTSRVVSWLTPDHGKIHTLIKGSLRPRSTFLGQYDLFYTCELLFYLRDRSDLYIARECTPLNTRNYLRSDYRAAALASYYTDLVYRSAPAGAGGPARNTLLNRHRDGLQDGGIRPALLFWYELKLLEHLGFDPGFRECVRCHAAIHPQKPPHFFSYAQGGMLCPNCAQQNNSGTESIAPDVLASLLAWQRTRSPQAVRAFRHTPRQTRQIGNALGSFIRHHLESALESREIALNILLHAPNRTGTA
jgi:DNA repair protein RecO (recombination protein O)